MQAGAVEPRNIFGSTAAVILISIGNGSRGRNGTGYAAFPPTRCKKKMSFVPGSQCSLQGCSLQAWHPAPHSILSGSKRSMVVSIWMCQVAAGATAFVLTDAFLPVWEWRGIDLAATFLNISGYERQ